MINHELIETLIKSVENKLQLTVISQTQPNLSRGIPAQITEQITEIVGYIYKEDGLIAINARDTSETGTNLKAAVVLNGLTLTPNTYIKINNEKYAIKITEKIKEKDKELLTLLDLKKM